LIIDNPLEKLKVNKLINILKSTLLKFFCAIQAWLPKNTRERKSYQNKVVLNEKDLKNFHSKLNENIIISIILKIKEKMKNIY
jgi:hypothetical protein